MLLLSTTDLYTFLGYFWFTRDSGRGRSQGGGKGVEQEMLIGNFELECNDVVQSVTEKMYEVKFEPAIYVTMLQTYYSC